MTLHAQLLTLLKASLMLWDLLNIMIEMEVTTGSNTCWTSLKELFSTTFQDWIWSTPFFQRENSSTLLIKAWLTDGMTHDSQLSKVSWEKVWHLIHWRNSCLSKVHQRTPTWWNGIRFGLSIKTTLIPKHQDILLSPEMLQLRWPLLMDQRSFRLKVILSIKRMQILEQRQFFTVKNWWLKKRTPRQLRLEKK